VEVHEAFPNDNVAVQRATADPPFGFDEEKLTVPVGVPAPGPLTSAE